MATTVNGYDVPTATDANDVPGDLARLASELLPRSSNGVLNITSGGTGASNPRDALKNLGIARKAIIALPKQGITGERAQQAASLTPHPLTIGTVYHDELGVSISGNEITLPQTGNYKITVTLCYSTTNIGDPTVYFYAYLYISPKADNIYFGILNDDAVGYSRDGWELQARVWQTNKITLSGEMGIFQGAINSENTFMNNDGQFIEIELLD